MTSRTEDTQISPPKEDATQKKSQSREERYLEKRIKRLRLVEQRIRPFKQNWDEARVAVEKLLQEEDNLNEIRSLRVPQTPIIKLFQLIGIVSGLSKVSISEWEEFEDHHEQHWTSECAKFCNTETLRKMLQYDFKKLDDQDKELLKGMTQDPTMATNNLAKVSDTCGNLAEYLTCLYSYVIALETADIEDFEVESHEQLRTKIKQMKKELLALKEKNVNEK
ncbi:hypothetical protein AKO1_000634 [Acrasis kona]|uniref:Uncharacterized protein n=1 Tax=Acrasis kona TaxID=1008807 RepID=A0AAW2ZSF1_9EUKA